MVIMCAVVHVSINSKYSNKTIMRRSLGYLGPGLCVYLRNGLIQEMFKDFRAF